MEITRRNFVIGGAACIGLTSYNQFFPPFISSAEAASKSKLEYSETFSILNRISYGAKEAECSALIRDGLKQYVDFQLNPDDANDALCNAKISAATLHIEYNAGERKVVDKTAKKPEGQKEDIMKTENYPAMKEDRKLSLLDEPIENLWKLADGSVFMDWKERVRPAQEVRAVTWIRAVHSQWGTVQRTV